MSIFPSCKDSAVNLSRASWTVTNCGCHRWHWHVLTLPSKWPHAVDLYSSNIAYHLYAVRLFMMRGTFPCPQLWPSSMWLWCVVQLFLICANVPYPSTFSWASTENRVSVMWYVGKLFLIYVTVHLSNGPAQTTESIYVICHWNIPNICTYP